MINYNLLHIFFFLYLQLILLIYMDNHLYNLHNKHCFHLDNNFLDIQLNILFHLIYDIYMNLYYIFRHMYIFYYFCLLLINNNTPRHFLSNFVTFSIFSYKIIRTYINTMITLNSDR